MTNGSAKRRLIFLTVNCSYSHSSLALPLLHSHCRDLDSWEWVRYDMTTTGNVIAAVRDIYALRGDLLAADLYLFNRQTALDVLQRYHTIDPECRIVAGGPEALGEGAEELSQQYPWLDCVFRGEGEEIFREYLLNFENKEFCAKRILPLSGNAVYANWAASAPPAADPFFVADKPFVQIETSRGCPMKCFYCTSGNTLTRYRELEQVRSELKLLAAKGVREVRVLDRTFNLPQERGAALLRMFREEFGNMKFHLELHPQFLGEFLREEIRKALPGQLHVEVGIQCLDKMVQQLSGRRGDTPAVLDGLKFLCEQKAFDTHADLLAGLPGQSWSHIISDTAKLMEIDTAEIQLEVLKALPGTPLRKIAAAHGIKYSRSTPYDVMLSCSMSIEDIQYARDLSRLLDITYNHELLHPAVRAMNEECENFVSEFLNFFHKADGDAMVLWDLKKRFLFVNEFCRSYNLLRSHRILAYQWLLAGYLQGQGPDEYSQKAVNIPEDAQFLTGSKEVLGTRESRYWSFAMSEKTYFLAYNRQYALNRPAAIWVKSSS